MRKILGASAVDIALMLSKDFSILVIFANLLAFPIVYFIVKPWLEGFPYRIDLGINPFLIGGLLSIAIGVATVSYHALKTATTNPIQALRYE